MHSTINISTSVHNNPYIDFVAQDPRTNKEVVLRRSAGFVAAPEVSPKKDPSVPGTSGWAARFFGDAKQAYNHSNF